MVETRPEGSKSEENVVTMHASPILMEGHSNPVDGMVPGLAQPIIESGEKVTGTTKNKHQKEKTRKHIAKQWAQEPVDYWRHHRGEFTIPTPKQSPATYRGSMCPSGIALHHPAADKLLEIATKGRKT